MLLLLQENMDLLLKLKLKEVFFLSLIELYYCGLLFLACAWRCRNLLHELVLLHLKHLEFLGKLLLLLLRATVILNTVSRSTAVLLLQLLALKLLLLLLLLLLLEM